MARRNRKKKTMNTLVFPVPFAGVVILAATFALAYVWLGSRCEAMGRDLKSLEQENEILERQLARESARWARTKSPQSLERALAKCDILMGWPRRDQVVWIYDAGPAPEQVARLGAPRVALATVPGFGRNVMHE